MRSKLCLVPPPRYTPYGDLLVLDANFANDADGVSDFANATTFTGRLLDTEYGQYYFRNRYYGPGLGRFGARDPIGYTDGNNLYAFSQSNPTTFLDPNGTVSSVYPLALQGYSAEEIAVLLYGVASASMVAQIAQQMQQQGFSLSQIWPGGAAIAGGGSAAGSTVGGIAIGTAASGILVMAAEETATILAESARDLATILEAAQIFHQIVGSLHDLALRQ